MPSFLDYDQCEKEPILLLSFTPDDLPRLWNKLVLGG